MGWVYAIGEGREGAPVKIGYATNVRSRLHTLQTGSSQTLKVLCSIPGDIDVERALHKGFASLNVGREWFRDSEVVCHAFDMLEDEAVTPALAEAAALRSIAYHAYGRETDDWNLESAPSHVSAKIGE